jgi:hypothetical protein
VRAAISISIRKAIQRVTPLDLPADFINTIGAKRPPANTPEQADKGYGDDPTPKIRNCIAKPLGIGHSIK